MTGFIESPNKWLGRRGQKPEAVVIHMTDGSYEGAHAWLLNPKSQVSAHFIINVSGTYDALVKPTDTAWHCGVVKNPSWKLLKPGINPNLYTIGIELALRTGQKPTWAMTRRVANLVREMCQRFNIPIDRDHIIGHREIRADKTCPGALVSVEAICFLAGLDA
jgi:N-acetyl-anhydromuramyl-L-alanine amidase AmpD